MRIERAVVAGAAGCLAMLRPLCALMGREGNALRTVRLGGNGAWAEGDGATLAAALGAASCVVAELDVSGSQLAADECLALANARRLHTLDLSGTGVAASAASLEAVLTCRLRSLALRGLGLGVLDGGKAVPLLCDALHRITSLRHLSLIGN